MCIQSAFPSLYYDEIVTELTETNNITNIRHRNQPQTLSSGVKIHINGKHILCYRLSSPEYHPSWQRSCMSLYMFYISVRRQQLKRTYLKHRTLTMIHLQPSTRARERAAKTWKEVNESKWMWPFNHWILLLWENWPEYSVPITSVECYLRISRF